VRGLVDSPAWRRSMAQAAREQVCRHHDARVTVGRLANLLFRVREARLLADAPRAVPERIRSTLSSNLAAPR
jgi:hypothetical protein